MDREFVIFEAIRAKKGGGTAIAIHEDLKPKLIEEYSDEFELLVDTDHKKTGKKKNASPSLLHLRQK